MYAHFNSINALIPVNNLEDLEVVRKQYRYAQYIMQCHFKNAPMRNTVTK